MLFKSTGESNINNLERQNTLHWNNSTMGHPVLVPSNNGNGSQQNVNRTCTKQPTTTTRQRENTSITHDFNPNSNINRVGIVSSKDILQAAIRPSTILKNKNYQTKRNNYCIKIIYDAYCLK